MELRELIGLYFERSNATQTYWNFYITIILALVAFFGSAKPSPKIKYLAGILTLAFILFAVVNHNALNEVTRQRIAAKALIEEAAKRPATSAQALSNEAVFSALKDDLNPPTEGQLMFVHLLGDVFAIAGIWWLTLSKSKEA
ncbi:MAG TPA: hypothetical protein VGV59_13330 [Pyrinomonadaceae bacterium]|nr:hypothetical protein [Pyrinomonadaceae bacterium]